jgi:hypothetical protein
VHACAADEVRQLHARNAHLRGVAGDATLGNANKACSAQVKF